jgi:hypothetical protein
MPYAPAYEAEIACASSTSKSTVERDEVVGDVDGIDSSSSGHLLYMAQERPLLIAILVTCISRLASSTGSDNWIMRCDSLSLIFPRSPKHHHATPWTCSSIFILKLLLH